MRLRSWGFSLWVLFLLWPGPTHAAEELQPGQPAPHAGALIEAAKVPALVEELREARRAIEQLAGLRATLDAQTAQLTTLLAQVKTLEDANARLVAAVKIAEEIELLRQKQQTLTQAIFERYDRALTQADAALDRAERRVDAADRRAWWAQILSVVGPLAFLVLLVL